MNFEQNLFISYAHIDDQPLTPGEKGWITRFHATLKAILSMRMGREAKIWRDEKLQGNDVFSDEIVAQFKKSAALVSILTSRYLNSEWCTREAHEFCQCAQQTGGVVVGNKSRVFKVIKTPVDAQESLPALMKGILGYECFTVKDGVHSNSIRPMGKSTLSFTTRTLQNWRGRSLKRLRRWRPQGTRATAMARTLILSRRRLASRPCILPSAVTIESSRGNSS